MIEHLHTWVVWFYCLKMENAALLLLSCGVLYSCINMKLENRILWKLLAVCALAGSVVVILYTTVGNRSGGIGYSVNLIPFHTYWDVRNGGHPDTYRSNFMNAALFYPAGLLAVTLLPKKWPAWCRCLLVVMLLCAMSAGIEFLQYRFSLGQVEIDDVIHNTLGALTGCLMGVTVPCLFGIVREKLMRYMSAIQK